MTPELRASLAQQILENEAWTDAFATLEASHHSAWVSTPADDWKKREQIYQRLQALMDVKAQLQDFIATGALR